MVHKKSLIISLTAHLNRVYGGPEDRVVVLDCTPVLRPVGVGKIGAILLQDVKSSGKFLQETEGLKESGDINVQQNSMNKNTLQPRNNNSW